MDPAVVGELTGVIATVVVFTAIVVIVLGIVLGPRWLKSRERVALQTTLRLAIEKGQPLPPEVIEAISRDVRPVPSPNRDVRRGVLLLCIAAAFIAAAAVGYSLDDNDPDALVWPIGFAAFPGFVGAAYLIMGLLTRGKSKL